MRCGIVLLTVRCHYRRCRFSSFERASSPAFSLYSLAIAIGTRCILKDHLAFLRSSVSKSRGLPQLASTRRRVSGFYTRADLRFALMYLSRPLFGRYGHHCRLKLKTPQMHFALGALLKEAGRQTGGQTGKDRLILYFSVSHRRLPLL